MSAKGVTVNTKRITIAVLGCAAVIAAAACGGNSKKAEPTRTGPVMSIAPISSVKAGEEFVASIRITNVQNFGGFQFTLDYDTSKVTVVSEEEGAFLSSSGRVPLCLNKDIPGTLTYACATKEPAATQGAPTLTAPTRGASGDGEIARVHLRAAASVTGTIDLQLAGINVVDSLAAAIEASGSGTSIKVQ